MPKDGKRRRVEGTEAKVKAAGGGGGKGIPSHWASSSARTPPTATAAAAAAAKATATSELPIAAARARLVEQVAAHPTVVLVGDTGSGKTTQLPQYLYRAGFCRKGAQIGCTQPRRVAAVSVAQRVASEMGVAVGGLVGYNVRFDEQCSASTRVKYLTDGMLLREAMADPLLRRYSVVILDEAHERTLHTDVLFAVVKRIQEKRPGPDGLKVVVMSATLEAGKFSDYFNNCPVLYVHGRAHPVALRYVEDPTVDWLDAAYVTIVQLHRELPLPGDFLVFLTGQDEIESLSKLLSDAMMVRPAGCPVLVTRQLYGALPAEQQMRVFEPAAPGTRKVILSTNIAETSLTISGVVAVIDSGLVKQRSYNPRVGTETLRSEVVSQAQARQRAGRAGREGPGQCYRLYTEIDYLKFEKATIPEILRGNLATVVLQLLTMGVDDVVGFDYMDPPPADALEAALSLLYDLGAIDEGLVLTASGRRLAQFPVDPCLARAVLAAVDLGCTEEILSVVALLSVENVFYTPQSRRDEADAARRRFLAAEGDHLTLLRVYTEYRSFKGSDEWCRKNFVNSRTLRTVVDTRAQLRGMCTRLDLEMVSCQSDTVAIRKALLAGLSRNVATAQPSGMYRVGATGQQGQIHPSSALFRAAPPVILYGELVRTSKLYFRRCTTIEQAWVEEMAPKSSRGATSRA
eukprot:m.165691 g.165691  ORF g.165691 m.165691 type:complete len:687 (-) comp24011_c0_seq1:224-2284(-)